MGKALSELFRIVVGVILVMAHGVMMALVGAALLGPPTDWSMDRIHSYELSIFFLSWITGVIGAYQNSEFRGRPMPWTALVVAHLALLLSGFLVALLGANIYSAVAEFERLAFRLDPAGGWQGFTCLVFLGASMLTASSVTERVRGAILRRRSPG